MSDARGGIAGKDGEAFWRTLVAEVMKSQISSTKLQTNLKFQYPMSKTGLVRRGGLGIVICLIFVTCDLEFLILLYSSRLPHEGNTPKAPLGGSSEPLWLGFLTSILSETSELTSTGLQVATARSFMAVTMKSHRGVC